MAGPRARALLQDLVREDLSNDAFPFLTFRRVDIGMVPAIVGRISFTGDLGYEIWVTSDYQRALYDLLVRAGSAHGLQLIGARALNSMRLRRASEHGRGSFRPIYGPYEAGLGRFIDLNKGDFIGRAAALEEPGARRRTFGLCRSALPRPTRTRAVMSRSGTTAGWLVP